MLSLHGSTTLDATTRAVSRASKAQAVAQARLGTGRRVNTAMDDAAGLQVATRLEAQSRGMGVALKNAQNATSMLQTGEAAVQTLSDVFLRMRDLALTAADASSTAADRQALQLEYDALSHQVTNIFYGTTFAGEPLLADVGMQGRLTRTIDFQVGASSAEVMHLDVDSAHLDLFLLGAAVSSGFANEAVNTTPGPGVRTQLLTGANAHAALSQLDEALAAAGKYRAALGAAANRLQHVYNSLSNMRAQSDVSRSRILDADFAVETANRTRSELLAQASTSALKQSLSATQLTLALLG